MKRFQNEFRIRKTEVRKSLHHRVDAVVHGAVPAAGGGLVGVGVPGEDEHRGVVVPDNFEKI